MTPPCIEPAIIRLVAQHLNHSATAVPFVCVYDGNLFCLASSYFNAIKNGVLTNEDLNLWACDAHC